MKQHQKYTKEWLEELCKNSSSIREVLFKAGRNPNAGGNYSYLKKKIENFEIDISHFTGQSWKKGLTRENNQSVFEESEKKRIPFEKLFVDNSLTGRNVVRRRIISDNLIPYSCNFCGNTGEWLNLKMALELDHINGKNDDHRLENLRFLCPNCHSITKTFSGKNNKTDSGEIGETHLV